MFFSCDCLIGGSLPITGAQGSKHLDLEHGSVWVGWEATQAAWENQSLSSSYMHLSSANPQKTDFYLPNLSGPGGMGLQAGAHRAAFQPFQPPDSSWYCSH